MGSNRFLAAGKECKDCCKPVGQMVPKPTSKTMMFYCAQGIKGFDALDDDPMKGGFTCDLVLCPKCEEVQHINFDNENTRHGRCRQRHIRCKAI
jgi:hypothetical protein